MGLLAPHQCSPLFSPPYCPDHSSNNRDRELSSPEHFRPSIKDFCRLDGDKVDRVGRILHIGNAAILSTTETVESQSRQRQIKQVRVPWTDQLFACTYADRDLCHQKRRGVWPFPPDPDTSEGIRYVCRSLHRRPVNLQIGQDRAPGERPGPSRVRTVHRSRPGVECPGATRDCRGRSTDRAAQFHPAGGTEQQESCQIGSLRHASVDCIRTAVSLL